MRLVILIFIGASLSWIAWGIAAICILHHMQARGDFHNADYQACSTVHNGPIERPDHYGKPYGQRKKDIA